MTHQNILHRHPFHSFAHAMDRIRANWAAQRKINAAYDETHRELSAMSTRELTDIGIDRADIPKVAAEAVSMTSG
ncbi:uncharacterized protein YjiS (DUF1127 family) [Yoonia maritima]|uniref:Uncharacterized protein YjiS (DUF1127 family) n=1 Tax=Yoonia maritima TaxID=1435347 RepID=A0A2T0W4Z0_9RHOB|nr:DUF1127 domain-containing protein [Yoonia maritima]PRY80530.1 uncharacterized protein YjiS (DUF1127 family) [Yoonia maritima]